MRIFQTRKRIALAMFGFAIGVAIVALMTWAGW